MLKKAKILMAAAVLSASLCPVRASARNVPFAPRSIIGSFISGADSVYTADLDRDGDLDVISADNIWYEIAWHENDGALHPGFTERIISTAAESAQSVYAADLDGDGDQDVLSASLEDDKIAWYENNGAPDPSFTERIISTAADGAVSVCAADLDGDGDQDVLSASFYDDEIAWYENDGAPDPGFTRRIISTAADGASSVSAADLDGDGDLDLLSTSCYDNEIAWYENNGALHPSFTRRIISTSLAWPISAQATDLDGDGDLDVLSFSSDSFYIAWFDNDGALHPSFTPRRNIYQTLNNATWVHAADLDGDGDNDVLSASYDSIIGWGENETIHRSAVYPSAHTHTVAVNLSGAYTNGAADLDGDGDLDIYGAAAGADQVAWWEFPKGYTEHVVKAGFDGARSVIAADLDRDGDLDLAGSAVFGDQIAWWEFPKGYTEHVVKTGFDGAYWVTAADLDGDGDLDLAGASMNGDEIAWWEFPKGYTEHVVKTGFDGVICLCAADLDHDGDLDLAGAATNGDQVAWWEFPKGYTEHVVKTGFDGAISDRAADLDGDGDLDLVGTARFGGEVAWWEFPGYTEHVVRTGWSEPFDVEAADLDGDGDLDLVGAAYAAGEVIWWENADGTGETWIEHMVSADFDGALSVHAADLDRDGDLDLIVSAYIAGTIVWWENRGGQFALGSGSLVANPVNEGAVQELLQIIAMHRGLMEDTDLELVSLELRFEKAPGDPLNSAEANNLIENLLIYRDDGDGLFDESQDTLVTAVSDLSLAGGSQIVTFSDGDPYVQVAYGVPRTYFLAAEMTENAAAQTPNAFRVTHHTRYPSSLSTAEDRDHDIPLTLEFAEDVTAIVTSINAGPSDIGISASAVSESAAVGNLVGVLSCADPEGDYPCSYEILSSGVPFGLFENVLVVGEELDYETQTSYLIWIAAHDSRGAGYREAFTITVTDVNEPPVAAGDSATVAEGGTVTILDSTDSSVADNDTDPEMGVLTLNTATVSGPSNGSLTLNADGTFSYTHNGSETTSDSFEYLVCDNGAPALCDTAVVAIAVNPVNDPPIAVNDAATAAEGGSVSILSTGQPSLLANDTDPDGTLTMSTTPVTAPVNGAVTLYPSGAFSYTHNGGETTADSFNYRVCDNGVPTRCGYALVTITITPVNDPPTANADSITVAEGGTVAVLDSADTSVAGNDTDPESGFLTVNTAPVIAPVNGLLTLNADGTFSYTHNGGETTSDSFEYRVCDNGAPALCDTAVVAIAVNPVNDTPDAVNDAATAAEGGRVSVLSTGQPSLLANDADPDGTLTVSTTPVADPAHGTVTLYASGAFVYTHDGSETTSDSFTYRACDNATPSLCDTATVSITVTPVNDPPVANADSITVVEGATALTLAPSGTSLLANDTDPEGALTVNTTPVSAPAHGTLTLNADGTFIYTHDGGETTGDSFSYRACDSGSLCANAMVNITITPVNDPPVAVNDGATVAEGGSVSILSTGQPSLLANDTDPDSTLTVNTTPVTAPVNGTVTLYASGAFVYTHDGSETTSDSFTYRACDGSLCDDAVANIMITPVNDPPAVNADSITVAEGGTAATLTPSGTSLLANDTDPDGTLTVNTAPVVAPVNGTLALNADGTFSYTHNGSETTGDSFVYQACDNGTPSLCATAAVAITVTPVDDPSAAAADAATVPEGGTVGILDFGQPSLLANDADPDGTLTLNTAPVVAPVNGTVTLYPSGAFIYTHDGSETDTDSFTYEACDGDSRCVTAVVTITVTPVNDPPVFSDSTPSEPLAVKAGDPLTFTVAGTDPESGPLALSIIGLPEGATFDPATGTFSWTPTSKDEGSKVMTVTASDGTNSTTREITILVTEEGGGGGGCGCTIGPNQPGSPEWMLMFIAVGLWLVVRKRGAQRAAFCAKASDFAKATSDRSLDR